jgi:hypothetical protein
MMILIVMLPALVSMQHIEEAVRKIRVQREMKSEEKMKLPQYSYFAN